MSGGPFDYVAVSVADGARRGSDSETTDSVYVYVSVEMADDGMLWICIHSEVPEDHPLAREMNIDEDALLGDPETCVEWMLDEGVAPGQMFLMSWSITYSRYWTDCGYEHDAVPETGLLWIEPWTPERSADAWQRWLDAGYV